MSKLKQIASITLTAIFLTVMVGAFTQVIRMSPHIQSESDRLAVLGVAVVAVLSYCAAIFFAAGVYVNFHMRREDKQIAAEIRANNGELE